MTYTYWFINNSTNQLESKPFENIKIAGYALSKTLVIFDFTLHAAHVHFRDSMKTKLIFDGLMFSYPVTLQSILSGVKLLQFCS